MPVCAHVYYKYWSEKCEYCLWTVQGFAGWLRESLLHTAAVEITHAYTIK